MQLKALYELCFPTVISSIFLLHPAHSLRSLLKKQANQMRWFTTSVTEQKAFPDKRSFFCWTKAKHKPSLRWQKERDGGVGHGTSRIEMLLLSLGFLQPRPEDAPGPAFMSGGEHLYWINLLFFCFLHPCVTNSPGHWEGSSDGATYMTHKVTKHFPQVTLAGWSLGFYLIINCFKAGWLWMSGTKEMLHS